MVGVGAKGDANGLALQWRNHLGGTPPAHLPRWLLMKILAYRIQAAAFGGLDKETLRVLRQPKGHRLASSDWHPFEARIATTREGTKLKAGALLAREWNGRVERVMILDQGIGGFRRRVALDKPRWADWRLAYGLLRGARFRRAC
jgi:Protein of unknown function (DUF2924)